MKRQFIFKRVSALILIAVLLLNCLGLQAFATDSQLIYINEISSNFDDPLVFSDFVTSGEMFTTFGAMPELSEEREVNWIDRIHNKPDYAVDFYNWLVSNETAAGALVSAHEEQHTDDNGHLYQVHNVVSYTDETYFDFTPGISQSEIKELAHEYVDGQIDDDFYTAAEWICEVYAAFDRDHPEVFWLSGGTVVSYEVKYTIGYNATYGVGYVKYTQDIYFYLHDDDFDIRSTAYCSHNHDTVNTICSEAKTAIKAAITARNNAVNTIISANTGVTDFQKIEYINKYLTENNYYNANSNTNNYSPLAHRCISALEGKTGIYAPVCDGYAKAFKVLCDKMNIPCVLVDGESDGMPHMWNYVQLDGEWYAVDVTRNDPMISKSVKKSGYENEKYLLVGSDSVIDGKKFSDSYVVHNTVLDYGISFLNEPLISKSAYKTQVSHICKLENGYCSTCYSKLFDVNRDTKIDIADLINLKTILLENSSNGNPDCDANGAVNSLDIVALKKHFWQQF